MKAPERIGQARTFDVRASQYRRAGLCDMCAAQAGYGHQLSFTKVRPPCRDCISLVQLFRREAMNGWRALP
jgi:hypothetical protein